MVMGRSDRAREGRWVINRLSGGQEVAHIADVGQLHELPAG